MKRGLITISIFTCHTFYVFGAGSDVAHHIVQTNSQQLLLINQKNTDHFITVEINSNQPKIQSWSASLGTLTNVIEPELPTTQCVMGLSVLGSLYRNKKNTTPAIATMYDLSTMKKKSQILIDGNVRNIFFAGNDNVLYASFDQLHEQANVTVAYDLRSLNSKGRYPFKCSGIHSKHNLAVEFDENSVTYYSTKNPDTFVCPTGPRALQSSNGLFLASACPPDVNSDDEPNLVYLWNLRKNGRPERFITNGVGMHNVLTACSLLKRNYLITADKSNTVKLWDIQQQQCLNTITNSRTINKFQSNSDYLFIRSSSDNTIAILPLTTIIP